MVRLAAFFGNRIADEEKRHAFLLCFADAYEKHCLDMAKTAEELLLSAKNDAVDLTHDYAELEPQVAAKF